MTEPALTSIAKSALTLFTSLAKDEFLLLWNSPDELQRLQVSIDTIGSLLQDADKMHSKGEAVLSCLSRLRNVMYDADDLFDSLAAIALRKKAMSGGSFTKEVRLFFSYSNQLGLFFKVAHQVKSLKKSLDHVKADMDTCGFRVQQPPVVQQVLRFDRDRTHSFVHQEDVIGRDGDKDCIINMLLPAPEDEVRTSRGRAFSVVAVIGFGGLGKTTLAQLVYRDKRVEKEFDVCLWACINDLSNLEQVLIEIIASKEVRHHDLGLEKLQEKLRMIIGGKKFLLVIDDLWDEDYGNWLRLDTILRCGINGRVLVTTRSVKVAECLDAPKSNCVDLEVLSEESAWSLFVKNAFYDGEVSEYPELEKLGKKIVSRCGNVPLAILVVGSLLRHKQREVRIWSDFLDNELGRVLSDGGSDKTQKSIKDVLMVSYKDLQPNLKLCFAYCSLFPKDHRFGKYLLVRLWISQGFVRPDDDNTRSLEELGEAYFFYLVDRCFFQRLNEYQAKMHDLLHDVAIDVAKTEIMFFDKGRVNKGKRVGLRHISVHIENDASFNCCNLVSDPSILRTILFHPQNQIKKMSPGSLDMLLTSFRMLRTLSLSRSGIKRIPDSIGELIHLRFLDLSNNVNLRHLPDSICKIHHLLTLNLEGCSILEKLPPKIENLISLRHLKIQGCIALVSLPKELAALTSLVNLDRLIVHPESGGLGYLNSLNDLCGALRIELPREGWPNAIEDAKRSNMSEKHNLKGLYISWNETSVGGNATQEMTKDGAEAVLEALEPSQNLEGLEIRNYGGVKLPSWFFMIKNVKELRLKGCDHVEFLEDGMKDNLCFTSLETLVVKKMKNLKGWWRQEISVESQRPCLAKVTRVEMGKCPEFKGKMPMLEGIESLDLNEVDVKLVSDLMTVNPNCSSPSSLSPFNINTKLTYVWLSDVKGLICLPEEWIRHLTSLNILGITSCGDLRWVSRRGLANLTALKRFELRNCECEIRDEDEDEIEVEVGMPWKALQRLETLEIPVWDIHLREGAGYLTSLESLAIRKWENKEGVELESKALQNLRSLSIGFGDDRICDLRKTGLHDLPFLTVLEVEGCKELYLSWKTLLVSMKLVSLTFKNVQSVIDVEDMALEIEQQSQLRYLTIESTKEWGKWVHDIPWRWLSSLSDLYFFVGVGGMGEQLLPNGIQHLSSLKSLYIVGGCEKVRSIPKWFPQLKSLSTLDISNCSEELKRRCEKEKGEDWPLICHIIGNIRITASYELREGRPEASILDEPLNEEMPRKIGWCCLRN